MPDGEPANLVLKIMLELFSESSITQEIRISKPKKKTMKFAQKENFEPKIKPMIENLRYKLYR